MSNFFLLVEILILIVASRKDIASTNIAQKIIDIYHFKETSEEFMNKPIYSKNLSLKKIELISIEDDLIFAQDIPKFFDVEMIIFVSRHESKSNIPILSVHTPGNLKGAEFGGLPRTVSIAPASSMRMVLKEMILQKKMLCLNEFEVTYECTHHGPSLDIPTMFVEVGSSWRQWTNLNACEAVARSTIAAISSEPIFPTVLGIGGPHNNQHFTEISLENPIAFGHIIPKNAIEELDEDVLKQCIDRTVEKVQTAILDWKGIKSKDKGRIVELLKKNNVKIMRVRDF